MSMAKKGSILICDDEEIMRDVLETILSGAGYKVDLAKTGEDAVELSLMLVLMLLSLAKAGMIVGGLAFVGFAVVEAVSAANGFGWAARCEEIQEAQLACRNVEKNGNPWGIGQNERAHVLAEIGRAHV